MGLACGSANGLGDRNSKAASAGGFEIGCTLCGGIWCRGKGLSASLSVLDQGAPLQDLGAASPICLWRG